MNNKRPEILSPAGDMERFLAAVSFGCDAVYLAGKSFGMRSSPGNFSDEELKKAIDIAHSKGIKVYITCNTLVRNNEIDKLKEFVKKAESFKADAFIVADIGVMNIIKRNAPSVDIHISTQAGIVNYETARAFYDMGAKRVVLARELTLEEIAEIRQKTNSSLELETFVHGAMCMSFSGRCLLSNYLTNRDANRGDCSQPCRWKYYLNEETRPGIYFPVEQTKEGTYIFNSRDMCMIEHIKELTEAGISSFKIEGRAKSAYYVAVVTNAYKQALNEYLKEQCKADYKLSKWILDEVDKISHREYSKGFYFGYEPGQVITNGGYIRKYDVVGIVQDCKQGQIEVLQRNCFNEGDVLDVLSLDGRAYELKVEELFDKDHNKTQRANKAAQTVYIKSEKVFPTGSLLRKKRETAD